MSSYDKRQRQELDWMVGEINPRVSESMGGIPGHLGLFIVRTTDHPCFTVSLPTSPFQYLSHQRFDNYANEDVRLSLIRPDRRPQSSYIGDNYVKRFYTINDLLSIGSDIYLLGYFD